MKSCQQNKQVKKKRIGNHLEQVNLFAAGIDIGSQSHFVPFLESLIISLYENFPLSQRISTEWPTG